MDTQLENHKPRSPRARAEQPLALSMAEAAAVAGIGRVLLYREIKEGRGPATFTIGGRRLIRMEELNRWLKSIESEQKAAA